MQVNLCKIPPKRCIKPQKKLYRVTLLCSQYRWWMEKGTEALSNTGGGRKKSWTKAHCCCYINLDTRMGIFLLIMIARCWASGSIFFPHRALAARSIPAEAASSPWWVFDRLYSRARPDSGWAECWQFFGGLLISPSLLLRAFETHNCYENFLEQQFV